MEVSKVNGSHESEAGEEPGEKFLTLWESDFQKVHNFRYDRLNGDRQAADKITKTNTPEALMELANRAWKQKRGWKCENFSGSLTKFVYNINEIRREIALHEDPTRNLAGGASRNTNTLNAGRSSQYANSAKKT